MDPDFSRKYSSGNLFVYIQLGSIRVGFWMVVLIIWNLSPSAFGQTLGLTAVRNLSELRAIAGRNQGDSALVLGYYYAGDGGGGTFYWDAGSSEADDGGMIVAPASSPATGRWKRLESDKIDARWFGAIGDGIANDTPALQAALNYLGMKGGGTLRIRRGKYLLANPSLDAIVVPSSTIVEGDGASTVIVARGLQGIRSIDIDGAGGGNRDITIRDLVVDCGYVCLNGVWLSAVTNGRVDNVRIVNPAGYGVWVLRGGDDPSRGIEGIPSKGCVVSRCYVTGVVDVGIELSGAVGCVVANCFVSGKGGIGGYYAWNGALDCTFVGNVAEGEGGSNRFNAFHVQPRQVGLTTETQRIQFLGNTARNVWQGFVTRGVTGYRTTDIKFSENQLFTQVPDSSGVIVDYANRVSVRNNRLQGFGIPLRQDSSANFTGAFATSSIVDYEGNDIVEGGTSLLFGNSGGIFSGNRFTNIKSHAARLYSWRNCKIENNVIRNLGDQTYLYNFGIILENYAAIPISDSVIAGNILLDDRLVKSTYGAVAMGGVSTNTIVIGNIAVGGVIGGKGYTEFIVGTNNVVSGNLSR